MPEEDAYDIERLCINSVRYFKNKTCVKDPSVNQNRRKWQENSYWIDTIFHGIIILLFRAFIETLTQSSLILPIQRENFAWLAHTWLWFRGMFSSLFPISICILTGLMRESSFYWSVTTYDTSYLSSRNINIISTPYRISWNLKCLNFTEIGGEQLIPEVCRWRLLPCRARLLSDGLD